MLEEVYEQGRCAGSGDHDLFFSERPEELAAAQGICQGCRVRLRCLEAALAAKVEWGVWGGIIFWDGHPYYRRRGRGRPSRRDRELPLQADP